MTHHEKAIEEMKEYLKMLYKIKNRTDYIVNEINATVEMLLMFKG
jgi:hypothetical protein